MTAISVPSYDFLAPGRIVFGWGRLAELGSLAAGLGQRAFVVLGSRTLVAGGLGDRIAALLARHGVASHVIATISREPEVADVDDAVRRIREHDPAAGDLMMAVGGGSAIDLAKATAALATNRDGASVVDYLEGVGRGCTIDVPPLPLVAVPTTAGTGAEATKNAVISSYDPPYKKSLRSDLMLPRVALVDPQLTLSAPASVTAHSGLDAITQLIESYISRRARPLTQALAVEGLRLALPAIEQAVADGASRPARESMAQAALLSGLALANSGLGMAHGVAAALGVHLRAAHGLACAVMLPIALTVNRPVCEPQLAQLARAAGVAPAAATDSTAADALVGRIEQICHQVGVPRRLSALGVTAAQIPALVRDARGNSMSGNPRELTDDELAQIIEAAL
ncbi:MAG: iron-containing alcohol dehydrogenase [Pirellulales bacterium]